METTTVITPEELKTLGTELRKLDAKIEADKSIGIETPAADIARRAQIDEAYSKAAIAARGKAPGNGSNMLPSGASEQQEQRNWARPNSDKAPFLTGLLGRERGLKFAEILGMTGGVLSNTNDGERRSYYAQKLNDRHGYKLDSEGGRAGFINERLDTPQYVMARRAAAAEMSAFGGSALIPSVVLPELEALLLAYGTARKVSRNLDLPAGSVYPPLLRGFPKVKWNPELSTVAKDNTQNPLFGNYEMKPKTLMGINEFSNTLVEDAVINYGDTLAETLVLTLQYGEDNAAFIGDSESGIVSLPQAFANVLAKFGTDYGTFTSTTAASATDFSQIPLTDIMNTVAKARIFNNKPRFTIICHPSFYAACLLRLMAQGGGNTLVTLANPPGTTDYVNTTNPTFLIFDVVLSNIMPAAPAASTTYFYVGDTTAAMTFGTRSEVSMLISNVADQAMYKNTSIMRVMERVDYVAHSVGGTTVDAANTPIAGPIARYVSHS